MKSLRYEYIRCGQGEWWWSRSQKVLSVGTMTRDSALAHRCNDGQYDERIYRHVYTRARLHRHRPTGNRGGPAKDWTRRMTFARIWMSVPHFDAYNTEGHELISVVSDPRALIVYQRYLRRRQSSQVQAHLCRNLGMSFAVWHDYCLFDTPSFQNCDTGSDPHERRKAQSGCL